MLNTTRQHTHTHTLIMCVLSYARYDEAAEMQDEAEQTARAMLLELHAASTAATCGDAEGANLRAMFRKADIQTRLTDILISRGDLHLNRHEHQEGALAPAKIPYTFENKRNAAAALSAYEGAQIMYGELAAQAGKLASDSPAFFDAINTIHHNPLSKVCQERAKGTILFLIACAQFQLEELEEAYTNCQASLVIKQRVLGDAGDGVHVATGLAKLGQISGQLAIKEAESDDTSAKKAQKYRAECISSFEECLKLRVNLYGVKHVYTADAYHSLGTFLVETGTFAEAERGVDLLSKGLKIRERGAGSAGLDGRLVWRVDDHAVLVAKAHAALAAIK